MPKVKKKQNVLADINAPAVPFESDAVHSVSQQVQPNSDPVLLAIQALTAKFESVETRLNSLERGGDQPQQASPACEPVRHEPEVTRKVYNTPKPVPAEQQREDAREGTAVVASQVRYVQPAKPNYAVDRKTIVPQNLAGKSRPMSQDEIDSIETESESFLHAAGLTNVKGKPINERKRVTKRSQRIIAVCTRCGGEHGKGNEWITSDMLQDNGQFICNQCLAGGAPRWQS